MTEERHTEMGSANAMSGNARSCIVEIEKCIFADAEEKLRVLRGWLMRSHVRITALLSSWEGAVV